MKIFTKFGDLILKLFDFIGMLILEIPNIPDRLRRINTKKVKKKIEKKNLKETISKRGQEQRAEGKISKISPVETPPKVEPKRRDEVKVPETSKMLISGKFTSEEKERTVLMLQILSGAFLVTSILYVFTFLSLIFYIIIGALLIAYILYLLFSRVKLMYSTDFNAYRDFFLMYVAVGIILALISNSPYFVMAFSFQFLPSLTILIFAVIAVLAVFLIFRIRYHRNYTYGDVVETGKKTAFVRVDYDICSNVKPDTYTVENKAGATEGDRVKLQVEENILSMGGNKPTSIIEKIEHFK